MFVWVRVWLHSGDPTKIVKPAITYIVGDSQKKEKIANIINNDKIAITFYFIFAVRNLMP